MYTILQILLLTLYASRHCPTAAVDDSRESNDSSGVANDVDPLTGLDDSTKITFQVRSQVYNGSSNSNINPFNCSYLQDNNSNSNTLAAVAVWLMPLGPRLDCALSQNIYTQRKLNADYIIGLGLSPYHLSDIHVINPVSAIQSLMFNEILPA